VLVRAADVLVLAVVPGIRGHCLVGIYSTLAPCAIRTSAQRDLLWYGFADTGCAHPNGLFRQPRIACLVLRHARALQAGQLTHLPASLLCLASVACSSCLASVACRCLPPVLLCGLVLLTASKVPTAVLYLRIHATQTVLMGLEIRVLCSALVLCTCV
jgi:hypothetical protein